MSGCVDRQDGASPGGGGAPTGPAGGDLTGTYPNPNVAGIGGAAAAIVSSQSPIDFTDHTALDALQPYSIADTSTQAKTVVFIGGVFNASPAITFTNSVFIWEGLRVAPNIQSLVAPSFAAFTMFQGLPLLRSGSVAGQNPLNPLVVNAGPTVQNEFAGTRTTASMVGFNWSAQVRASLSGAVMNVTNHTFAQVAPTFSTVAGATISFGAITGMRLANPAPALFQPSAGVETMTSYVGVDMDNITFGGNVTKAAVRSAQAAATNAFFLLQTGTAQSRFTGSVTLLGDLLAVTWGASSDFSTGWGAAGFQFFQFNASADQLRWSNPSADRFLFDSSTGTSEFNWNCDRFSIGAQTGAVGNQVGAFVAPARTVTVGGEFSQFLLTQGGNLTIDANVNAFGWTVNAPSFTAGTGTLTTAAALNVGGNPNLGVDRVGVRIISNPTGGAGVNAALWVTAGSSRFDGRVDINQPIALGGGAAATLGTIGGTGPTAAAQAQWVEIDVGGVPHWIPAWT